MAHVAMHLHLVHLCLKRYIPITACLLAILLFSWAPNCAADGTPGYGTVNLALGKTVTPLTGTVMGSIAGVNDGGPAGYWYSFDYTTCASLQTCTETDSQGYYYDSFTIDLGAEYSIGRVDVYPAQTRGMRVYSSLNGTDWIEQHKLDGFDTTGLKTTTIGPVTFDVKGAYSARYLKYEGWAWWDQYVGMSEFEVYEWQTNVSLPSIGSLTNLALGKQAGYSGGAVTPGQDAFPNLTDGDPFTYWQPVYAYDNCEYVYNNSICPTGTWYNNYGFAYVDLGDATEIQAIRLTFPVGAPGSQSYIVDISNDTSNNTPYQWWSFGGDPKTIASYPPTTNSATQTFYFPAPVTGRYVWVSLFNWTTAQPLSAGLAEIEVFGALAATSSYTISAAAGAHGTISPAGQVSVDSGSNKTFTITPSDGYQVDAVRVDGASVGPVTTYTFSSVAADHTINATFTNLSSTTTPIVVVTPSATNITTAQALVVLVTVDGGGGPINTVRAKASGGSPTPTGTVMLSSGSYASAATALSGGQTTITVPAGALAVGSDTLTATYTPDADSPTYTSATGSAPVTVILAPPIATLGSSSLSFTTNVGATSAAQVVQLSNTGGSALNVSSITLSGTGAAAFAQSNNCGSTVATGASCNISVTFSPTNAANYNATVSVADDAAGSPQTVSLSGTGVGFTITAPAAAQTILPAHAAAYTITVTAQNGTFSNAVALGVSGMPAGATASFAPASVTPGSSSATSTLTIQVPWASASNGRESGGGGLGRRLTPFVLALILLPFAGRLRRTGKRLGRMASMLLILAAGMAASAGLSGCDANTGFFGQAQKTYVVTVTGTSGALSRSATVTLIVE